MVVSVRTERRDGSMVVSVRQRGGTVASVRTDLFAVVRDRGQDGAQRLEAHGDVQQVGSEEEVVVVSQNRHGHVPGKVQEGLQMNTVKRIIDMVMDQVQEGQGMRGNSYSKRITLVTYHSILLKSYHIYNFHIQISQNDYTNVIYIVEY